MQVTVEVLPGLERKMLVKVPSEGVQKEVEKRLKDLAPRVKIDGFRPGKVPFTIVRQRYEDSVRREVVSEVIGSTYQEALQQEKLTPAGLPKVHLSSLVPGEALQYEATFEVFPVVKLHDLKGAEIESFKVEVDEQDIDDMLEKLRKQQAEWIETDQPAEKGNRVVVDFESLMDGVTFEGGTGKKVTVELGTGAAIPDFENALLGTTAGQENITFDIRFPENYHHKPLAGKSSSVTATVHKVLASKLPALDEEFAKKLGVSEGGLEQLRKEIRENLIKELENNNKTQLKSQIMAKLLELNPLELPQTLIDQEIHNLQHQEDEQATGKQHKHDHDHHQHEVSEAEKEKYTPIARQRVGLGLLFGEIIREHQLKLDPAKVQAMLEKIAAPYKDPQNIISWYRGNKEQMARIESVVIEEQIADILLQQVTIKETIKPYRELVNSSHQETGSAKHDH